MLFVSFVAPHFPLTAPPEHFYPYYLNPNLPWPKQYGPAERPAHPYLKEYGSTFAYDEHFKTPDQMRRAVAGYCGLCRFLDENIGSRGLWGKSTMYEEACGVPTIIAGPGVPQNKVCETPISHVDFYPTILEATGQPLDAEERQFPGRSLFEIAAAPDDEERIAFAEYHGMGSSTGAFMVRAGRYKYIYYAAFPAQLYDLEADPEELTDLAGEPAYQPVAEAYHAKLLSNCDPQRVDATAKKRQAELLALNGVREAVIARGDLGFSPPPGVAADMN